ncbi:MAG: MBOAT family protein [Candidatus Portnoybacteria bacterium]|nr:MBOAT family protein [Candidatus Portnoybacteria bacterium]
MLFNSLAFLIFFPIVIFAFFLIPRRYQWVFLLLASAYFYMSFMPWYILVLVFLILLDYSLGRMIEKQQGKKRKLLLILSIIGNLGTLLVFKYFNFFNQNISYLADVINWNYSVQSLKLILPIGLSFHIFQSLSYVIEVYRGKHPAEKHLGIYALYVMFFPQLVAGPIERPQHLLPQLHQKKSFDYERVMDGLTLMLWGFFKKLVIADQLALMVDKIYGGLYQTNSAAILLAVVFFAYQLYCDFSGYSDIAIGSARVLGVELVKNFDRPYASRSITEFWRRWHISLSSWLRDYMYYPLALAAKKKTRVRLYWALFITFVLIGLWHGANWTFVMLGATHGFYLIFGQATKTWREKLAQKLGARQWPKIYRIWQIAATFGLVCISWVFFRAQTLNDAWHIISNLPKGLAQIFDFEFLRYQVLTIATIGSSKAFLSLILAAILFMEIVEFSAAKSTSIRNLIIRWPLSWRLGAYYLVILWILMLGYLGAKSFIYFQF